MDRLPIPIQEECIAAGFTCNACTSRYKCLTDTQRRKCSDLQNAMECNNIDFNYNEILDIWAVVYGENDGNDWFWVVELKDRRFALVQGGCDYTGWD